MNIVPFDGKYDGNNHDAVTITGIQPTDSVKYSYNGENLDSVPVIVDAGEYAVTVTIKRINYEDYVKKVTARIVPTAIDGLTIQPTEFKLETKSNIAKIMKTGAKKNPRE